MAIGGITPKQKLNNVHLTNHPNFFIIGKELIKEGTAMVERQCTLPIDSK